MTTHPPTPLSVDEDGWIYDADGRLIASVHTKGEGLVERLVQAFNVHEDLVEVARATVRVADEGPAIDCNKAHYVKARAALACQGL